MRISTCDRIIQVIPLRGFMMFTSKDIIIDNNLKIREKSSEVAIPLSEEDQQIARALLDYVLTSTQEAVAESGDYKPAVGMAAIQVGIPKKILAIGYDDESAEGEKTEVRYLLANAKIIQHSLRGAYLSGGEGCLSVEEVHEGYVIRAQRIKVRAFDILANKEQVITAEGYLAIVMQHEIDHFNGILYYDRINKNDPYYRPENCVEIT